MLLEPLAISWGWGNFPPYRTGSAFLEQFEWRGTRDPAAYLSVPAAIRFQAEHDWPRVRAECHELLREARRRIEELVAGATHHKAICPDSAEWVAQMAAFPLPPCDAMAPQRRLYNEHRVEVPVVEWNGRQPVRVSVQGYNTRADVEALWHALAALRGPARS